MANGKFYTLKEAGVRLGCSTNTVRQLVLSGQLMAIDIGPRTYHAWRISSDSLEHFEKTRLNVNPDAYKAKRKRGPFRFGDWMQPKETF